MNAPKPATALPWAAVCIGSGGFGPDLVEVFDVGPVNADGETLVRVAMVAGADAAFIVAAVNAHADLVAALEQARDTVAHLSRHLRGRMGEGALAEMDRLSTEWAELVANVQGAA